MKKVDRFEADDGTIWKTAKEALKRGKIHKRTQELISILGGNMGNTDFLNGGGFYQISAERVRKFDNAFIEAIKEFEPWIFEEATKGNKPFTIKSYFVGRALDDSGSVLYSAVMTRHNVDDKFRRWGQPYYAANPSEGKQNKLGDIS